MTYTNILMQTFPLLLLYLLFLPLYVHAQHHHHSCRPGVLQCASEYGDIVDFCSVSNEPQWVEQDQFFCSACTDISLGNIDGVQCDAAVFYNREDGSKLPLKSLIITQRRGDNMVISGAVRYEVDESRETPILYGEAFAHEVLEHQSGATFFHTPLPLGYNLAYSSVKVKSCFQLVVNGHDEYGEPIHFAVEGPTEIIDIEEPLLWLAYAHIESIEIAVIPKCALRNRASRKPEAPRKVEKPVRKKAQPAESYAMSGDDYDSYGSRDDADYGSEYDERAARRGSVDEVYDDEEDFRLGQSHWHNTRKRLLDGPLFGDRRRRLNEGKQQKNGHGHNHHHSHPFQLERRRSNRDPQQFGHELGGDESFINKKKKEQAKLKKKKRVKKDSTSS